MKTPQKEEGNEGAPKEMPTKMVKIKRTSRFKLDHLVVKKLVESREQKEYDYQQLENAAKQYASAMQAQFQVPIEKEGEPSHVPVRVPMTEAPPQVPSAEVPIAIQTQLEESEPEKMEEEPEGQAVGCTAAPTASHDVSLPSGTPVPLDAGDKIQIDLPVPPRSDVQDDESTTTTDNTYVSEQGFTESPRQDYLPSAPLETENVEEEVATPSANYEKMEEVVVEQDVGALSVSSIPATYDSNVASLSSLVSTEKINHDSGIIVQVEGVEVTGSVTELEQGPNDFLCKEFVPASSVLIDVVEQGQLAPLEEESESEHVEEMQAEDEADARTFTPEPTNSSEINISNVPLGAVDKISSECMDSDALVVKEEGPFKIHVAVDFEFEEEQVDLSESAPVLSSPPVLEKGPQSEATEKMEAVDVDTEASFQSLQQSGKVEGVFNIAEASAVFDVGKSATDACAPVVGIDNMGDVKNNAEAFTQYEDPENMEGVSDVKEASTQVYEVKSDAGVYTSLEDLKGDADRNAQFEETVQMEAVKDSTEACTPTTSRSAGPLSHVRLDMADKINPRCSDSDIVVKEEGEDVTGSIFELEQDEISTPKGSRRGKLAPTPNFTIANWIKPEVLLDEMWQKRKTLRSANDNGNEFHFPSASYKDILNADSWEIPRLMDLKEQLNRTKSHLDYLPLEAWHHHTKRMNISNLVMSYVKRYFNPEFSSVAWGKFFEMLCTYAVIPADIIRRAETGEKVPFNSIHLCEAPGAFISALNHFLKTRYPGIDWNWLATTLNPYHEGNDISQMINDDRLILMSLNHWTFLEDSTGNILNNSNLKYLIKQKEEKLEKPTRARQQTRYEREGVMLVTADGSIDCQSNPAEQERIVAHLQYGEIIAALSLLRFGGTFILKIFTFLEAPTICNLYLLSCVFKEVHLFKPATSKEGNSEVYVVCLGFLGKGSIRHVWQSKLVGKLETHEKVLANGKVLLPLSMIPKFFINRLMDAAEFFCGYQMKIIMRNWNTFGCDTRIYNMLKPFRMEAAEEWLEYCELKPLQAKHRLISDVDDGKVNKPFHLDFKTEEGCFADKAMRAKVADSEKLGYLQYELNTFLPLKGSQNHVLFGAFMKVGPVSFEKPYSNIRCSRFCLGSMLSIRQEVRELVKPYKEDLIKQGLCEMADFCKGHDKKRVHASMSKSCDVEFDNLEIMCFNKLTFDFVTKTDFEQQQEDLIKLFDATFNRLGKDRSMFLCRYPMLSRLQVGLIFCLASVFEKVIIYGDASKQVVGIMLYKFLGLTRPELKNMMQSISDIFEILTDADFNLPVLQLVPMKRLVDHMPCEFLVKYNIHILKQDIQRSIGVIHSLIASSKAAEEEHPTAELDASA